MRVKNLVRYHCSIEGRSIQFAQSGWPRRLPLRQVSGARHEKLKILLSYHCSLLLNLLLLFLVDQWFHRFLNACEMLFYAFLDGLLTKEMLHVFCFWAVVPWLIGSGRRLPADSCFLVERCVHWMIGWLIWHDGHVHFLLFRIYFEGFIDQFKVSNLVGDDNMAHIWRIFGRLRELIMDTLVVSGYFVWQRAFEPVEGTASLMLWFSYWLHQCLIDQISLPHCSISRSLAIDTHTSLRGRNRSLLRRRICALRILPIRLKHVPELTTLPWLRSSFSLG